MTKRIPINPRDDLLTRNLGDVYHQCLQILATKNYTDKRINSKLYSTKEGLVLAKGSWWLHGPPVSVLSYKNVLQYSSCPGRPAKILVLITNDDRTKTELVVIKTKGLNYANFLLTILQKNVSEAHQRLVQSESRTTRPVNYQMEANKTSEALEESSTDPTTTPHQKRRPAPVPPMQQTSEILAQQQLEKQHKIFTPRVSAGIEPPVAPPARVKKNSTQSNGYYGEGYSRTSYDPETKVETLDSVVYYGQNTSKRDKSPVDRNKHKKTKSRPPRELSTLGGGRKVSRELDENNTPWEVNICYIKHDPLVGCVEDESGPIYMYTAHQLVPRDDREYNNYDSEDSDEDTVTDDESDDGSSTNSQDSLDENKELERFMMMGRNNHTKNGTNGKLSEVYEY